MSLNSTESKTHRIRKLHKIYRTPKNSEFRVLLEFPKEVDELENL